MSDLREKLANALRRKEASSVALSNRLDDMWDAYSSTAVGEQACDPAHCTLNPTLKLEIGPDGEALASLQAPRSGVLVRYGISSRQAGELRELQLGVPAGALSPASLAKYVVAGILTNRPLTEPEALPEVDLPERGYVRVPSIIGPLHTAAIRRYVGELIERNVVTLGDGQVSQRYVYHNDPHLAHLHESITPLVSTLSRKPMRASYRYLSAYTTGSELQVHTDREQCEVTVSVLVDYSPLVGEKAPWPIYLRCPSATMAVFQSVGEALVFRGQDVPHFREKIQAGHSCIVVLFHYVDATYQGSLD